ncbi:hypothetical protein BP6252_06179 [Coleophoma cylindrospora]|uniref:Protein kinase domain-containing protein n=1 Tax=Coleophoma cylindrospora TaxID=1849047 RepID=A0A3D8RLU7_9HELO|nr:hypothetical protein BP6252_06179 [Coleophoma cylindrospora]
MAEVLGTALGFIGAVGVLGQVFDGCLKAYAVFTAARSLGRDSERLVCKIRIEEMRLMVWGREWGVAEGRLEAHLRAESNAGNGRMRQLAIQILSELHKTITDFNRLQDRYGLRDETDHDAKTSHPAAASSTAGRVRSELHLRAKWVIADKDKFTLLLTDLKDYNDGLEQLFPPSRLATLHRTWQNELLEKAHRDIGQLSLLETASSGVYPQLNASASLKQLRINLDAKPTAKFRPTHALKVLRNNLQTQDKDPRRSSGAYQDPSTCTTDPVVIEWVEYDKDDPDARFNHIRRIDDLARMIHGASDRHPDLHTLDCLGYTDDTSTSRYGLIYSAPATSSSSLHSLISSDGLRTPDLGDRFKLAHTLAVALWALHSLDWLHKSLSCSNILFFPSAFSSSATKATAAAATIPDISSPFLLGFDASRPDSETEMSIASRNPTLMDLHRHPASLNGLSRKPYCKCYDIYSLGLILLEIGLWKTVQTYHKSHYTPEKFRDKIIVQALVPALNSKTGSLYREVVERCLFAREDLSGYEAGQLMEFVVGSLEGLRV